MWNQLSKRHLRQRAGRSEMPLIFWGWATQSRTNKSGRAVKQQLQDTKALALMQTEIASLAGRCESMSE